MATAVASMTGAQFDALPFEEGRQWELLDGELVPMPSPTFRHQDIVSQLLGALRSYLKQTGTGGRAAPDVEFALTDRDRVRPDVFVLLGEKAKSLDWDRVPVPGSPDIAIEVISPTERAGESQAKVRRYLHSGASEVWRIYPLNRAAELHTLEFTRTLECPGDITSPLLPGFSLPLESLFD